MTPNDLPDICSNCIHWLQTWVYFYGWEWQNIYAISMAPMLSALGSVVNAKPESARWLPTSSRYIASSPANLLTQNELVQCIHSLDQMSQYNVAYLCESGAFLYFIFLTHHFVLVVSHSLHNPSVCLRWQLLNCGSVPSLQATINVSSRNMYYRTYFMLSDTLFIGMYLSETCIT